MSNESVLGSLTLNHPIPNHLIADQPPNSVYELAMLGADNPALAQQIWYHVFTELTEPGRQDRPPTLFAIDGLDHWMGMTQYRSADYDPIHAHQFVLIKQLLSLLFTDSPLHYGGMVVAATTQSNNPVHPSFSVLLKQIESLNAGLSVSDRKFPLPSPYSKPDLKTLQLLPPYPQNTTVTTLSGLSKSETTGLLKYFANSGVMADHVDARTVAEKWTLSSGGIVGELCKLGVSPRVDPKKTITRFGTQEGVRMGQGEHKGRG